MPYGIKNEKPEQTKWMERCVSSVMEQNPKYKGNKAIVICKAQLKKNNWKVKKGEAELSMREELWELETKIREAINGPGTIRDEPASTWVEDVFDDYVIVNRGDKKFKVDWSISGEDVKIDWDSAVEVERKTVYEPSEADREITTKVPDIKKESTHRRITWGPTTIN